MGSSFLFIYILYTVIVKAKSSSGASGGGEDKKIKKNTEFIHIYNKEKFNNFNKEYIVERLDKHIDRLKNEKKSFSYKSILINFGEKKYIKSTVDGRNSEIKIYEHSGYEIKSIRQISADENISEYAVYKKYIDKIFTSENAQTSIRGRISNAINKKDSLFTAEYIPVSGKNKNKLTNVLFIGKKQRLVSFLINTCDIENNNIYKKSEVGTFWGDISWSSVFNEGGAGLKNGKKPEKLLQRIIHIATKKGDTVLDYHLGSGTTCAVAHKMGRQYIGIEQMVI
jgi:adenine-specific DNA-methyltransferase